MPHERKIIDIHNHPNWNGVDVAGLVANMDRYGIEKTWLLSWEATNEEFNIVPEYHEVMDPRGFCAPLWMVVESMHKYSERLIGGWAPDPRDRYARAKLKAAVEIHGIKVYGELKCRMRYDTPDAIAMFRYCAELGLPVLFHLQYNNFVMKTMSKGLYEWPEWYGGDISVVENMCKLCPDTQFIGHGPEFWRSISADADKVESPYPSGHIKSGGKLIRLLEKYSNLHCDLSANSGCNALKRDLKFARQFLSEFRDSVMFGRDCFDNNLMDVINELKLSDEITNKILYQNAERVLADSSKGVEKL